MPKSRQNLAALIAFDVFMIVVVLLASAMLRVNQGTFTYTLDDPYIHLALAENIEHGHYGVNAQEFSAPSSSIIWPLLLAALGAQPLVPLIVNLIAAALALFLFHRLVLLALPDIPAVLLLALLGFFVMAAQLVESTFTGMEHSLQVAAALLLVYGWLKSIQTDDVRLLLVAVVVNPLVRYENLMLCLAVVVYWLMGRRFRRAVILGAASGILPGVFSLFLLAQGLGLLPTSVRAKISASLLDNLRLNVLDPTSIFITFAALALIVAAIRRREVAVSVAGVLFSGLFLGFGHTGRYTWFAAAALLALLLYVYRDSLRRWFARPLPTAVLLLLMAGFSITPVLTIIRIVPGSHNIYDQQYQMHRFAADFWKQSIAVNDLGWVSYHNDGYVLDLFGLASPDALQQRLTQPDARWIPELMRAKTVQAAILYPGWFPDLDSYLIRVASLRFSGPLVATASSTVYFYALTPDVAGQLRASLYQFAPTLPPGVTLRVFPS